MAIGPRTWITVISSQPLCQAEISRGLSELLIEVVERLRVWRRHWCTATGSCRFAFHALRARLLPAQAIVRLHPRRQAVCVQCSDLGLRAVSLRLHAFSLLAGGRDYHLSAHLIVHALLLPAMWSQKCRLGMIRLEAACSSERIWCVCVCCARCVY